MSLSSVPGSFCYHHYHQMGSNYPNFSFLSSYYVATSSLPHLRGKLECSSLHTSKVSRATKIQKERGSIAMSGLTELG